MEKSRNSCGRSEQPFPIAQQRLLKMHFKNFKKSKKKAKCHHKKSQKTNCVSTDSAYGDSASSSCSEFEGLPTQLSTDAISTLLSADAISKTPSGHSPSTPSEHSPLVAIAADSADENVCNEFAGKSVKFNPSMNLTRVFRKRDAPILIKRDYCKKASAAGLLEVDNLHLRGILRIPAH